MINLNDPRDLGLAVGVIAALIALIMSLINAARLSRLATLKATLEKLNLEASDQSVLQGLTAISHNLAQQSARIDDLQTLISDLSRAAESHTQKIGIVRYNAFDQMGADLSFSAAILDANKNGLILTGLYGREESRVYCKPIHKGESTYLLTDEEQQAIRLAAEKTVAVTNDKQESRLRRAK